MLASLPPMNSVLVVCTGNVCRSPIGEGMLRAALQRRFGADAPSVSSAGTAGWEGSAAMPESIEAARERGVDVSDHVARRLVPGMVEGADLVVCMAGEHRDALQVATPQSRDRIFTLKELVRLLEAVPAAEPLGPDRLVDRIATAAAERAAGFDGNPYDEDVIDPLGLPLESYRAIAWELDEWSERLIDALFGPDVSEAAGMDAAASAESEPA
jgi:protein-tyrosine phosphatase